MNKIIDAVIVIGSLAAMVASVATIFVLGEIRTEIRMHDVVSEVSDSGSSCGMRAIHPDLVVPSRHGESIGV